MGRLFRLFRPRPGKLPCAALIVLALLPSLTGCVTGIVPGEDKRILQNLAREYYDIAAAYADLKKYDKALEYYKLAGRNKELQTPTAYQIARMNALSSKWAEAEKSYRSLLKGDPKNADLNASLAYVLAQNGQLEEAENLYRTLAADNPYNEKFLENYIRMLAAAKKDEDARSALARFTERFPTSDAVDALTRLVPPPVEEKIEEKIAEEALPEGDAATAAPTAVPD